MKSRLFNLALFAILTIFLLAGCRKDPASNSDTKITSMDDLKVASTFNWEMTRDVTLTIGMNMPEVTEAHNAVTIYNGDPATTGKVIFRGYTGNESPMVAMTVIPTVIKSLFITLAPSGQPSQTVMLPVTDVVSYTFQAASFKSSAGVLDGGPECTPPAGFKLSGSQKKTIDDGLTYYISDGTFTGDVDIKEGKLIVCGTTYFGDISMGPQGNNTTESYLEVSSTGTLGSAASQVKITKGNYSTFSNWGTCHIDGNYTGQDALINYAGGTILFYGHANMNGSNGSIINYGYIGCNIDETSVNGFNAINYIENYKTIEVFGKMNCNNSEILNKCKLIVHGDFHLNNCEFTNETGYIECDGEFYDQGGTGFLYLIDQSLINTYDMKVTQVIEGKVETLPGTLNSIVVTNDLDFTGNGSVITGFIETAQTDGVLYNGTPEGHFTNGATFVSIPNMTNYIPASECSGGTTPPVTNTVEGTAVYEDLWPGKGDYDFNDLVLAYQFEYATNFENRVTQIIITLDVKAVGASYYNGFGIQFDQLVPSDIASVTGYNFQHNYITLSANGTEAGNDKAVVIAYDDADNLFERQSTYFNTEHNAPVGVAEQVVLYVNLTTPMLMTEIGTAPYNPFIIRNMERQAEIHLPDFAPTFLAKDCTYFGTMDDNTIPAQGRYYKTDTNLPWALNIPVLFDYPWEMTNILLAYNHFADWAQSSGELYPNWYEDLPGYRNDANIWHP